MSPQRKKRRWLPTLGLFLATCLLCLAVLEGIVRIGLPQPVTRITPELYLEDPPLRFRMRPGASGRMVNGAEFDVLARIDDRGSRAAGAVAPDGARRALFLGDSFTFGWGVENADAFPALLQASMATGATPIDAFNAGAPGYGPVDHRRWLEHLGDEVAPDLVVLCVFLGNDLLDATDKRLREELSFGLPEAGRTGAVRGWFFAHSHLVRLFSRAVPVGVRRSLGLPVPWAISYLEEMILAHAEPPGPVAAEGRRASHEAYRALVDHLAARSTPVIAVLLPANFQLDTATWTSYVGFLGIGPDTVDPRAPSQFFLETFEQLQVPVLDLTPVFQELDDPTLYFHFDPHWTAAGHRVAADAMRPFVHQALREIDLQKTGDIGPPPL